MPARAGLFGVGALIGGLSGLAGVGGAMISVPFMTMWGVPFQSAIGTSAAISFVVAVAGTVGYVAAGLTVPSLPAWTVGYVYLPALLGISVTSVFVAPVGRAARAPPAGGPPEEGVRRLPAGAGGEAHHRPLTQPAAGRPGPA